MIPVHEANIVGLGTTVFRVSDLQPQNAPQKQHALHDAISWVQPPAKGQVPVARHSVTPESYVMYGALTPVDEDEVREAVEKLLLGERAPPALLKVVGRNAYDRWALAAT